MVATNSMGVTRSSLELMLDKIQQRDAQPKDVPPALPVRPVSRARLPRARRPLQLDFERRNSAGVGFESGRTKKEEYSELFHHEENAECNGFAAQSDHHVLKEGVDLSDNSKENSEGASNIQKWYRGHKVRCYYKEVRRGAIELQSFVRGENARRSYQCRSRRLRAIILIQKHMRKYFEHRVLEDQHAAVISLRSDILGCQDARRSNGIMHERMPRTDEAGDNNDLELAANPKKLVKLAPNKSPVTVDQDRIQVPYRVLIDLQKQVLRSEAKVREKKEENTALKLRLQEMEKKWQQYEERMKCMEKSWQDQFTYIQKCLAAAKNNPAPGSRRAQCNSSQRHYDQNHDTSTIVSGLPNGGSLDFSMHSIIHYQVDRHDLAYSEDCPEIGHEQVCSKLHPQDELRKLKRKFKTWKKDYKNKLREAQATFKSSEILKLEEAKRTGGGDYHIEPLSDSGKEVRSEVEVMCTMKWS
ncbi:UNVERIFIED_CONTAM: Myosin-2 [Sesamum angustifolium]|uniref:Myosin-2 n=1 Tax=Sesamum angustifolium TaxID=2727405 RepID=A0AAW2PB81_9LAMI